MTDIGKTIFYLNREQEERHTQEYAKKMNLPYVNLTSYPIVPEVLAIITKESALRYQIVPYLKIGKTIKYGAVNPKDKALAEFVDNLSKESGFEFIPTVISRSSLLYGLLSYEQKEKKEAEKKEALIEEKKDTFEEDIKDLKSTANAAKQVSTTRLLDVVMTGAVRTKASDVHFEPSETDFLVRYRIDGVLQDVVRLPIGQYKSLLARVKFLAKLKMDNSIDPQDGRFSLKTASNQIDLRVSTLPSASGESVVIRLLGQEKSMLRLDGLGFRPDALSAMKASISRPHGMVLTSGPTGSGKSSTLYAVLMELNKPNVKIITLEDPIEYKIPGVEQSQVKKEEGYTFALGLRASLRQDPDIIMVGEIRDAETAEIAVQAALTGHLMLSTIHANTAPGVFVRLLEIGVKPFLLAGSVNLVMAQRLVRKICQYCKEEFTPTPEVWQEVQRVLEPIKSILTPNFQKVIAGSPPKLTRGKGCPRCGSSGFSGRQVIIEVLAPNTEIEKLIAAQGTIADFDRVAKTSGMISMEQDGLIKVLEGITTIEEVWRVTKE